MKKIIAVLFLVFLNCTFCFAQDSIKWYQNKQHSLFVEFFGNAFSFYNITYECSFKMAKYHKIAIGLGGTFLPLDGEIYHGLNPQINYLYGAEHHHIELGIGYYIWWDKWSIDENYIPMRIGYRYQRDDGGFFWKIAFVLLNGNFYFFNDSQFIKWGGVSFGYTFKKKQ